MANHKCDSGIVSPGWMYRPLRLGEELVTAIQVSASEFTDLTGFLVCRLAEGS